MSGASLTPPETADSATRSQWLTCDAATRLAIRNHLPLAECAHFGQHRTAQAMYDAVVTRYSSPATAALGRAAHGTRCTPFFEGCSPSPLAPSYTSTAAVDVLGAEDVGAASANRKRRNSKGKGGKGGGSGSGGGGEGISGGGGGNGGGGGGGSGSFSSSGGGTRGGGGSGSGGSAGGRAGAVQLGGSGSGQRQQQQQRRSETPSPQQLRIEATALGASESALLGTALTGALHTFTVDTGASRWAPVLARPSTVLLCPAVPSGSLTGLHPPSFSTNLASSAALQDAMVTTTTPGGQRVSICTCTRTDCHLATFTRRPGSSLYTLATDPPQTLLWHHRLGHPSLPRLRGMHFRLLVSGLPMSLPPLPPSPAPLCLSCVEGRQRAAPHSSSFPPMTAPLQTLNMDVWGRARVSGQGRERYLLLVVDDYMCYTMVFTLRSKGEVPDVLIPWICTFRLQLRERFREDLPVLRLHYDRGGTYVDEVPPPGANIVSGMWIFRVKRPPGSPPVFKARYVARGFSQRQGVDYFQTFSPTPKMTTLRVLLHVAAQREVYPLVFGSQLQL
ncbi:unnamed protein product [Closterium sp. NIES-53]